jgi:glycosyltransferase involved in cell wall biosynthesis
MPRMSPGGALRFCVVSTFYPPYSFGGDGIYAERLAHALARRGHRVTVVHSPSAYEMLAGGPPGEKRSEFANLTVHALRTPLGALGVLAVHQTGHPMLQGAELRRLLDGGTFDVVHYNNVSLLGGPAAFGYGRGLKLCTLSDHWLVCPMHTLWKFDREVCTRPTCFRCTLAAARPPQLWRSTGLIRREARHIDAFLAPSFSAIRQHQERGLEGTFVYLPQFHRPHPSPPASPPATSRRPYFLYAGRLEKLKGVQTVIPVLRARPDVDLLIAGAGGFEPELRALAAGAPNIIFAGKVDAASLDALYRGAVGTIVPSLCYETFGLVVAESFAAGTPVIVRALGSLEEIVRAQGGGTTYRSAEELGRAVDELRSDSELRRRLASEAAAAFRREFSEEAHLDGYLALARELLARKRAGQPVASAIDGHGQTLLAGRPTFFGPSAQGRFPRGG